MSAFDPKTMAGTLIEEAGSRARTRVVDQIVKAIRDHDLPTAHLWDEVGRIVDEILGG